MNFSTLFKKGVMRGLAVAAFVAVAGMAANAQTFIHEGVVYKVSKGKLTVQKPSTAPENGEAPGDYTGDIVVPSEVTYNGTTYPVEKVSSAFKETGIKSIKLGKGIAVAKGSFEKCTLLVTAELPSDLSKLVGNTFFGCKSLESIAIPGSVPEIMAKDFEGCISLKEFIIEEGAEPINLQKTSFGSDCAIEKLVLNREVGTKFTAMDTKPFRNLTSLTALEVGGNCTTLPASYFEGATSLASVTLGAQIVSFDTNVFANTAVTEVVLPEAVTAISDGLFKNCGSLANVTLGSAVTSIGGEAFAKTAITKIVLPETLERINTLAFSGAKLAGDIVLPAAVTTIGAQAFANNADITSIALPATVKSIGTGAFMGCTSIASFDVAAENEYFAVTADKKYLTSKDGLTLIAYAPAAEGTELAGDYTTVEPYAVYGAKNLESVNLPNCTSYGDYAFYGSSIKSLAINGKMGRSIAAECANLEELTVNAANVPTGVATNSINLKKVNLLRPVTVIGAEAFKGCTALESLDLGNILSILESDCFAVSGIKTLKVGATYPAAMSEGVFTAESGITVNVPTSLVEAYKAATGWNLLNIVGDDNIAVGGAALGMPAGLYYAGDDNDLHCVYSDGQTDDYDVNLAHMFQLVEFSNRIYGASAGERFVYTATSTADGDGKLFYISQVDGEVFQATVLDNAGNNAYKDPFGLYIYGTTLYVNDRNVCVRKISADALALPQDYPSWMENNWMAFYSNPWSYGCIKAGFAITSFDKGDGTTEPLYWLGMKTNGQGIFSFKEGNIGTGSATEQVGPMDGATAYLTGIMPIITTFNIDTKYGYMYIYIEKAGNIESEETFVKGGVYRIKLEDLEQTPNPSVADFKDMIELVDGAPVMYEGSATHEHVGISQFSIDADGEYMYWCYRAPTEADVAEREAQDITTQNTSGKYWWAEKFDAENSLHKSGIKRIKLGNELPKVEMVAEGVTGYGVVAVNYDGSKKPEGFNAPVVEGLVDVIAFNGNEIVVSEDAVIYVYNTAGAAVAYAQLAAGEAWTANDLAAGIYVVEATTANGKQAIKIVK